MGDLLSSGIPLNVHVCGNEEVKLTKTTKSMITETLSLNTEFKVLNINDYGFSFKSSDDKC